MSCHFSPSWHCQKIQGWGWLAGAGVPTHPVEKEREVSQLAVKRVHYATEYFLVIAIFCVFQNIHKLARQNQIFSKSRERKCSKVNMLNQSLDNQVHSQALYHDSAGFTLVNCSTMWIFSGELERILGFRELVKPQRHYRDGVLSHIPKWVIILGWWMRCFLRPSHSSRCYNIPCNVCLKSLPTLW